ncbi:50S ribosomal protein L18e [Pyrodictium delaneyi]|uniref:Large ribosomal subunit protein eL18 n=1 Tax=Pyrodictium delaneyi TaxID=1273541 RepID=A0A0N7JDF8_9CREN|nr:50S ribosomal protein L18e [Pyrodictium delaneyi]ALL02073.1 50S ribosomal protein L18e [Pyrodictium delaneyi]OWJ54772.1 50S ribosomal protein L18e [Pyrodictium delaneyi]
MQTTKRTGPTNIVVRKTIRILRSAANKNNAPIWRYVAELIDRPRRLRVAVNISKINRYTEDGDIVVVPGKVLGAGTIDHPVTVAALGFSEQAVEKIRAAGGKVMHILQLVEENPRGSRVKIII